MRDNDFEGLRDRNDEQQQMGIEQQRAISEILDDLDAGKRLNSGQVLFLRWFCGVPLPQPKDYAQNEMPLGFGGKDS